MNKYTSTVNATEYPPQLKHKVIFETFDELEPEQSMLLINDHDPQPLYYQFSATRSDQFSWEYVEQGPEWFRVKITKQ
ncbi:DUF2249 domain-containing protein [Paenibacillus sp. SN-8-1]|uniref:DUF2249 domain-containing protein n=1 Tax=Paenibacillus sp. SN-8-1 TaxID=3435409 RepID=UPI003D9A27D8